MSATEFPKMLATCGITVAAEIKYLMEDEGLVDGDTFLLLDDDVDMQNLEESCREPLSCNGFTLGFMKQKRLLALKCWMRERVRAGVLVNSLLSVDFNLPNHLINTSICKMGPKRFKLNIGGTKYEVSDTLLDGFPESMLRKITSDTWNQNNCDDGGGNKRRKIEAGEIFIERDGGRFKYVLDFMRDGTVTLPPSIPRQQLVKDMEYYGIDFDESKIALSVTDKNDLLPHFIDCYKEWRTFQKNVESKQEDIEDRYDQLSQNIRRRYREIGAECLANKIALQFFELHFSEASRTKMFKARVISVRLDIATKKQGHNYSIDELQSHLDQYGLKSCDLIFISDGQQRCSDYYNYGKPVDLQLTIDIPH